jgi:AcrR family transcriptional regulator
MMRTDHPPTFKERVKQEREQEILHAARDVFSQRGFEKASIDEIAERVGIGKGTVYLHFASKEELLVALMRHACDQLTADCERIAAERHTALEKLDAVMGAIASYRFANERLVRVIHSEMPVFLGVKEKLSASHELRRMIAEIVVQGQAEGSIDPRIRPAMATVVLLFLIFSACGMEELPQQEHLSSAKQLYFHGLVKEAAQ